MRPSPASLAAWRIPHPARSRCAGWLDLRHQPGVAAARQQAVGDVLGFDLRARQCEQDVAAFVCIGLREALRRQDEGQGNAVRDDVLTFGGALGQRERHKSILQFDRHGAQLRAVADQHAVLLFRPTRSGDPRNASRTASAMLDLPWKLWPAISARGVGSCRSMARAPWKFSMVIRLIRMMDPQWGKITSRLPSARIAVTTPACSRDSMREAARL